MKKLWSILTAAAAAFCLCSPLPAAADETKGYLADFADTLTDAEKADCLEDLNEAAALTGMNIGVVIGPPDLTEGAGAETAMIMYEQTFGDSDGVFCFLDAREENPQHYIYTVGDARFFYPDTGEDGRIAEILVDLESFISPSMDMAGAITMLNIDLEYFYSIGMEEDVYVYEESDGLYYYVHDGQMLTTDALPDAEVTETEPTTGEHVEISDLGNGNAVLYDEGGWLDSEEYNTCLSYLQNAADTTGMNVAMVLGSQSRSEYTIESLADASYDELFGPGTDGLLYYMDLSGADSPYDYISTCGMGQMYYTNDSTYDRINAIFDVVFPYLTPAGSEDVPGAVEAFADEVIYYYEQGIPDRYYVYDDVYDEYYYVEDGQLQTSATKPYISVEGLLALTAGGLLVGLIAALITFFGVKMHYRFKSALTPTAYVNRKNLVFHHQYDRFVREYTTRTKIESSSGGGRSGGGGGGRSSGGHGGGGRHR